MPIDWSPFVEFVRSHQRFLIMTHVRPDGDALGSQIGLACALRKLGKSVRVAVASDLGPRYEFANTPRRRSSDFAPPATSFEMSMPSSSSIRVPGANLANSARTCDR